MGIRRYLLWTVCALATLVSCDRSGEMPLPADDAIRFDNRIGEPFVSDLTKGAVTTKENLSEFGVFAYYSATGFYSAPTSKPDYMYNIHVTRPDGVWTYTPLKFWPQGSVSFFAYTPHTDTNKNVSVVCTTGAPVVAYSVPNDVKAHCDLMLCAPALNHTKKSGAVMLTFSHALACIDFNAHVNSTLTAGQSIKVTDIRIGKFRYEASCNHESPYVIMQIFSGNINENEYTISVANQTLKDMLLTTGNQQITSADGCPMIWPQMIDDTDKLFVTAEYTSSGKTRAIVFERNIKDFVTNTEAGKRYIFNLLFSPFTNMTLTCQVVPWDTKTIDVPDFD